MNINIFISELKKCILHNDIEYAQQLVRYLQDNYGYKLDQFYANYINTRMSVAMYEQVFRPHLKNNIAEFNNLYVGPVMYKPPKPVIDSEAFYVGNPLEGKMPKYDFDGKPNLRYKSKPLC